MSLGANDWGVYFLQVTLKNCDRQTIASDARFGETTRFARPRLDVVMIGGCRAWSSTTPPTPPSPSSSACANAR